MSTFDADSFMSTQVSEEFETRFVTVPEGEYPAVIDKVEINQWHSQAKGTSGLRLDVTWKIDDAEVSRITGLPSPTVRQGIMLDLTDSGGLATGQGKNINLGRLREAVGQNRSGQPWSFSMLAGQVARVKVSHRIYEGETYAEVKGVTKL
jgi:hypothetical protein